VKHVLLYAKDLSIAPGGATGNTEMLEFSSLWRALRHIARTKAARRAVLAGRFQWLRVTNGGAS
jgi:hypothetical protein